MSFQVILMGFRGVVLLVRHHIVLRKILRGNAQLLAVVVRLIQFRKTLTVCRLVVVLVIQLIVHHMMKMAFVKVSLVVQESVIVLLMIPLGVAKVSDVAVQVRHLINPHKLLCVVVHLLIRFPEILMDCKLVIQRELSLIVVHMMRMENVHRQARVHQDTSHIVLLQQELPHVVDLL